MSDRGSLAATCSFFPLFSPALQAGSPCCCIALVLHRYKLQDYWETPMWSTNSLRNTTPPTYLTSNTSLWAMGNWAILCKLRLSGVLHLRLPQAEAFPPTAEHDMHAQLSCASSANA